MFLVKSNTMLPCLPSHVFNAAWSSKDSVGQLTNMDEWTDERMDGQPNTGNVFSQHFIIDREAREIMYLVASVCPSVCPSVRLSVCPSVRPTSHGSRSIFWRAAVDIRGSALPSAAKGNKSHYQSKVFVCVSVISRHMRIIARMRSIGF